MGMTRFDIDQGTPFCRWSMYPDASVLFISVMLVTPVLLSPVNQAFTLASLSRSSRISRLARMACIALSCGPVSGYMLEPLPGTAPSYCGAGASVIHGSSGSASVVRMTLPRSLACCITSSVAIDASIPIPRAPIARPHHEVCKFCNSEPLVKFVVPGTTSRAIPTPGRWSSGVRYA